MKTLLKQRLSFLTLGPLILVSASLASFLLKKSPSQIRNLTLTKSSSTQANIEVSIEDSYTKVKHPLLAEDEVTYNTRDIVNAFYGVLGASSGMLPPVVRYF